MMVNNMICYDTDNLQSNIVGGEVLKRIQGTVLRDMKNAIISSMGPAKSNTLILTGNNSKDLIAEYSKDGNKIVKNILYQNPIEMSIQTEIRNITSHIERVVGDGTSSAVVLSSLIFDQFIENMKDAKNPYKLMRDFAKAVENVKEDILSRKRECTIEDIYNISYIATNGNDDISSRLAKVYEEYGMNVFIDVSASINENTYTKEYDGLTLEVGYSDPSYMNTNEAVSRIGNVKNPARIYAFQDPIDTPQMVAYFERIATDVMQHINDVRNAVPTVILAPTISRDMNGLMRKIIGRLAAYGDDDRTQKPPFLVITNINGINNNHYHHIAQLCGCKMIAKYIDPEMEKKDQDDGIAPTIDTILNFCGWAEQVEADANSTKFIRPENMYEKEDGKIKEDADGMPVLSKQYNSIIGFLSAELHRATTTGEHVGEAASIKRQINALKANMIEFFVGGVSISDRDSLRDLVEDAVLNCRSAAAYGVGYGANVEGFRSVATILETMDKNNEKNELYPYYEIIYRAYIEIMTILYGTVLDDEEEISKTVFKSLDNGPYNLTTEEFDGKVLTSIMSDITILDTISKIVSIMFTSNQALVQAPNLNMYK